MAKRENACECVLKENVQHSIHVLCGQLLGRKLIFDKISPAALHFFPSPYLGKRRKISLSRQTPFPSPFPQPTLIMPVHIYEGGEGKA